MHLLPDRPLAGATEAAGILVRRGLDEARGIVRNAQRPLRNPPVGLDHLLQVVPSQLTLNHHKVLHRAGGGGRSVPSLRTRQWHEPPATRIVLAARQRTPAI